MPPARLDEKELHYAKFGGVSPLPAIVNRQAEGLAERLRDRGIELPVHVAMRHSRPFIADALAQLAEQGVRRAIGFICAAYHSPPSCYEYKLEVAEARRRLVDQGRRDLTVTHVPPWYDHPLFIQTSAELIRDAFDSLPSDRRDDARLIFTAHSIPTAMAETCQYREELHATAGLIADRLGRRDWTLVYQSRSGRPQDPWLEPDISDYLRNDAARTCPAAVIAPIGFVCDHIEVLYDLDQVALSVCRELGLPAARAKTVNDAPTFLDMMADVVQQTWHRYEQYPPLPIVGATA